MTTAPTPIRTLRDTVPPQLGGPNTAKTLTERDLLAEPVYWLEVSRSLHNCRHVDPRFCD